METKLYIGNLAYSVSESDLHFLFSQAGLVKSAELIRDRITGRSKGFAFVVLSTKDEANTAITMFHGKDFMGRPLTVNMAKHQEQNESRELEAMLYIGNLAYSVSESDLHFLFSAAGSVKSVELIHSNIGTSKAFAFVVMSTKDGADTAIAMFHGKDLYGHTLIVYSEKQQGLKENLKVDSYTDTHRATTERRSLHVFLCHAHSDVVAVRALYKHLIENNVDAWLDKENLLPGSDWEYEIRKAVCMSDVVVVCLSRNFNQQGFRQKEVRLALDTAMEQPEGEIFIIPARLEECDNLESLRKWHWVNLFESDGYERLMQALRVRAKNIGALL